MILVASVLGGLGLICILTKRTLLGIMIGVQLLVLGASMIFVLAGASSGAPVQGHIVGLFVTLGGVAQLVVGFALSVRLYLLRKRIDMEELRSLKQ